MRSVIRAATILGCAGLVACGDGRYMRVGTEPLATNGIPVFQQVDDSVRLFATEWRDGVFRSTGVSTPTSDEAESRYEWSSSNSAIAVMRPSGWMVARAIGHVVITVSGPRSSYAQAVTVCSRDTYLRIDPRDPDMKLHDTITVSISLPQASGGECGRLDFGPFMPQEGSGRAGLEPIFSQPNRWRAISPGAYWYTSTLALGNRTLRDSVLVNIHR
jgi:hypothetical protein